MYACCGLSSSKLKLLTKDGAHHMANRLAVFLGLFPQGLHEIGFDFHFIMPLMQFRRLHLDRPKSVRIIGGVMGVPKFRRFCIRGKFFRKWLVAQ